MNFSGLSFFKVDQQETIDYELEKIRILNFKHLCVNKNLVFRRIFIKTVDKNQHSITSKDAVVFITKQGNSEDKSVGVMDS